MKGEQKKKLFGCCRTDNIQKKSLMIKSAVRQTKLLHRKLLTEWKSSAFWMTSVLQDTMPKNCSTPSICQSVALPLNLQERALLCDELDIDVHEQIRAVIEKKYRNLSDEKVTRRAVAALQRLGYRWDDIKSVLSEYNEDETDEF